MNLFEMFDAPISGYQDPNSDNSKPTWRTSRKTKLTLKQLRQLRRMMDVRNYERTKHLDKIRTQYGVSKEQQGVPGL